MTAASGWEILQRVGYDLAEEGELLPSQHHRLLGVKARDHRLEPALIGWHLLHRHPIASFAPTVARLKVL
ncbi:hypothetical protein D1Z90_20755 [Motilimonas pumila]|uniref:Uncharacterized protein n=1 Tax=Motilimonas pumila TaxID=2303987 RepID=A0A418Y8Z0_9GAMM|nr:hypothetical protein D1Z90_20755 [Motilimonas pumila]